MSVAFPRFTARDFQMLGKFSSEATAKALFNVGANGIKAAGLLLHQFTPAKIFLQNLRVPPKIIE